ncbi:hypothetical protein JTE90_006150, partial [Oedothorax gibbosus]
YAPKGLYLANPDNPFSPETTAEEEPQISADLSPSSHTSLN